MPTSSFNARYAIGLDVGGTKIAGGLVALDSGEVLARRIVPTEPHRGGEAVLATAVALVKGLLEEAAAHAVTVDGIGIGVCELVDPAGSVTSGHTVEWQGLPVQERFAQLAPAVVEADVRAAALAEALYGAGRTFQHFVYVTVGTGISSCLVQEGRPWAGARGNALVLATGPITITCPECGATVRTILEEVAAGPALVSRYNAATGATLTRGQEVVSAVEGGDAVAMEIVRRGGEALGVGVGWLVNVLDPEAIVVGGGLGVSGGLYWSSFVESTRSHVWSEESRTLPILTAQLGTDAGVIGAAAVFRERSW
jgi:glucokinase